MPSSPKSNVKKMQNLPKRKSVVDKQSGFSPLDTYRGAVNKAGEAYGYMLRNQPLVVQGKASVKAGANAAKTVARGAAKRTAKDIGNVAQFGGNQAKSVIREAQGLAKMVLKGFGN
jgi:hypothetical protein